jgi:hypothetical protein
MRSRGICTGPYHKGPRDKEVEIKAFGMCATCHHQFWEARERDKLKDMVGASRPDRSQRNYQKELSKQRILLSKVVLELESQEFTTLPRERVKSIIQELNQAIRILDNTKDQPNPEVSLTSNVDPSLTSEVSPTPKSEVSLTSTPIAPAVPEVSVTSENEPNLTSVKADPAIQAEILAAEKEDQPKRKKKSNSLSFHAEK